MCSLHLEVSQQLISRSLILKYRCDCPDALSPQFTLHVTSWFLLINESLCLHVCLCFSSIEEEEEGEESQWRRSRGKCWTSWTADLQFLLLLQRKLFVSVQQEIQQSGDFFIKPESKVASLDTSQWPLLLKVKHLSSPGKWLLYEVRYIYKCQHEAKLQISVQTPMKPENEWSMLGFVVQTLTCIK